MKVLIVFGTRPEAIKMAPVIGMLRESESIRAKVCVTAQHRQMLDQVLTLFDIQADYDLNLMKPDQSLVELTSAVLHGVTAVMEEYCPDLVMVQGDTTTTFASALAAYYRKIPVAHVEAGLRTNDIYAPWPEEMNRRFVSRVAAYHFAPTLQAKKNLHAEGAPESTIHVTGNTVIDALLQVVRKLAEDPALEESLGRYFTFLSRDRKLVLVTGHRRESFGEGFQRVAEALRRLAAREDVEIVYPVHLNPHVQAPIRQILNGCPRVHLIPPLDYLPFVYLLSKAYMVITDSGGIQEEAPALGKPVLVMRDRTERPEGIAAGTVRLVGTTVERIVGDAESLLDDEAAYQRMARAHNPYGDGLAAKRIICVLEGKQYAPFV